MGRYSFDENLEFGNKNQNLVVKYLTENFDYKFIAGDIDGKTIGQSEVEKICNCRFLPIVSGKKGASLEFKDRSGNTFIFTMPDELFMKKSNGKYRWAEIKSSRNTIPSYFDIPVSKVKDYLKVEEFSGIPVYVILVSNVPGVWDKYVNLYYLSPSEIIDAFDIWRDGDREDFYRIWLMGLKTVNSEPILVSE